MTIPAKLPHPPRYNDEEKMSQEDWEEYFANRKKLDKPISQEETEALLLKGTTLLDKKDEEEFYKVTALIPMPPAWAKAVKDVHGFKMVSNWNLYEAKKVFPDEF
ncbi:MAG: hypothetical protein IJ228_09980 [Succinivibrio sp.]|nr:hypothetical protein [Succinivibrio sp.]